jgi:hypothetical protein
MHGGYSENRNRCKKLLHNFVSSYYIPLLLLSVASFSISSHSMPNVVKCCEQMDMGGQQDHPFDGFMGTCSLFPLRNSEVSN